MKENITTPTKEAKDDCDFRLNYNLKTIEERIDLVSQIIEYCPSRLTSNYLEILADYVLELKVNKKEKDVLTKNRLITVNKRETSFEGLVSKLENGEDGIYALLAGNDKNIFLTSRMKITPKDIEEIPELKRLKKDIEAIEKLEGAATGKKRYLLKKQLIEMRQQQYVVKAETKPPINCTHLIKNINEIKFDEEITVDKNGVPNSTGIVNFFDPKCISLLLNHYVDLKEAVWGNFNSDAWAMMEDFDKVAEAALQSEYPHLYDLMIWKIDGKTNQEIKALIKKHYDINYNAEYISNVWRNRIPKIIAEAAKKQALLYWYKTVEKEHWKRCTRCHERKPVNNFFFSKNVSSADGFYSICKDCRRKKSVVLKRIP